MGSERAIGTKVTDLKLSFTILVIETDTKIAQVTTITLEIRPSKAQIVQCS